jgi:hypothetical protein
MKFIGTTLAGFFMGLFIGGGVFLLGLLLTLTIIGAIIGIPLMVTGLGIMVSGGFTGIFLGASKLLDCPICHNKIRITTLRETDCRKCNTHLTVIGKGKDRMLSSITNLSIIS